MQAVIHGPRTLVFVISAVKQFVSEEEALQEAPLTHIALAKNNNNVSKYFKRANFT